MNIEKRINAIRAAYKGPYDNDVGVFVYDTTWKLLIGNRCQSISIGEAGGDLEYKDSTLEKCLQAAERDLGI